MRYKKLILPALGAAFLSGLGYGRVSKEPSLEESLKTSRWIEHVTVPGAVVSDCWDGEGNPGRFDVYRSAVRGRNSGREMPLTYGVKDLTLPDVDGDGEACRVDHRKDIGF